MSMPDLHAALLSFQMALRNHAISPTQCQIHADLRLLMDNANGQHRLTYALINGKTVKATVTYLQVDRYEGEVCFQVGYAVANKFRSKGVATATLRKSLDEMRNGFRKHIPRFYVEAIVDVDNAASRKVAERVISDHGVEMQDGFCGRPAVQFLKLIEC